ncbi:MotE family protein [Rhodopila sp.]|uniref:MotE family protein n=1 Tax=Rhodopila sp. TaxID=2480087 RepID=UPI003D0A3430
MLKVPAPRLLPTTITVMAAVLLLKCGVLLEATVSDSALLDSGMVASANAASSDETKEPATPAPPTRQKIAAAAAAAATRAAAPQPSAEPSGAPPPVSDSEKALLQELRQRRRELDARAQAINARESVLAAAERTLSARVDQMQALQTKLEGLDAEQKRKVEAGWAGLVKVYEVMKPRDAATIFNDLTMPVLLQVMDRMKDAKAAAIMAAMNPDKARDVTAELAQMRTGRDASGVSGGRDSAMAPVAGLKPPVSGG